MDNIGKVLHGFCGGFFGRDSYTDKCIEAEGRDWIVVRERSGKPNFAWFNDADHKQSMIDEYSKPEDPGW